MQVMIKRIIKYIAVYIIAAAVMTGLLVGVACIPQKSIKENVKKSADFLCSNYIFLEKAEGIDASTIDRYADSILVAIAYQYDSKNPLKSVMWSSYYTEFTQDENLNLRDAVAEGKEANQQYLRYWHGSNVVVRTLLLFLSLKGIYIFNAVMLCILLAILIFLLVKAKAYMLIAGLAAGLVATSVWFVPFSLEYTWIFYIMLVMSIIMVVRETRAIDSSRVIRKINDSSKNKDGGNNSDSSDVDCRQKTRNIGIAFMICGMVTCFMDFLTTELLTLLVPLMIVMYFRWRSEESISGVSRRGISGSIKKSKKNDKKTIEKSKDVQTEDDVRNCVFGWKKAAVPVITWGIGYAGMWLTKWLMASIVLGRNVMPYVKENLEERINGEIGIGFWDYLQGALDRNVKTLMPWGLGAGGVFAALVIVFACLYMCYVYKKKTVRKNVILIYAALAVIPFVRFLVLHNHSYLHFFFTFRVLGAVILALVLIMGEIVDFDALRRKGRKKNKARR